jgi:hypothetical protein
MNNDKLDDTDKQRLIDFATKEAQLVWNRYGCMIVANAIFLGFIGQLATKESNVNSLEIYACGMGLIIALVWLFLTSYGWSLSAYAFSKSGTPEQKVYQQWKEKVRSRHKRDPMWWFAHVLIFLFCIAYILLTFQLSKCRNWPVAFTMVFIIASICWWFMIGSFDEFKDK